MAERHHAHARHGLGDRASVSSMKCPMREIGTAISCLMLSPSAACASGICSRKFQNACDCDKFPLRLRPPPGLAPCAVPSAVRTARGRAPRFRYPTVRAARSAVFLAERITHLREMRGDEMKREIRHQLEAGQQAARRNAARARKSSAACGEASAASAVTRATGAGCSFITAAVMMPSVPSAPMNRSRRS
jgi:hypothetical protein